MDFVYFALTNTKRSCNKNGFEVNDVHFKLSFGFCELSQAVTDKHSVVIIYVGLSIRTIKSFISPTTTLTYNNVMPVTP